MGNSHSFLQDERDEAEYRRLVSAVEAANRRAKSHNRHDAQPVPAVYHDQQPTELACPIPTFAPQPTVVHEVHASQPVVIQVPDRPAYEYTPRSSFEIIENPYIQIAAPPVIVQTTPPIILQPAIESMPPINIEGPAQAPPTVIVVPHGLGETIVPHSPIRGRQSDRASPVSVHNWPSLADESHQSSTQTRPAWRARGSRSPSPDSHGTGELPHPARRSSRSRSHRRHVMVRPRSRSRSRSRSHSPVMMHVVVRSRSPRCSRSPRISPARSRRSRSPSLRGRSPPCRSRIERAPSSLRMYRPQSLNEVPGIVETASRRSRSLSRDRIIIRAPSMRSRSPSRERIIIRTGLSRSRSPVVRGQNCPHIRGRSPTIIEPAPQPSARPPTPVYVHAGTPSRSSPPRIIRVATVHSHSRSRSRRRSRSHIRHHMSRSPTRRCVSRSPTGRWVSRSPIRCHMSRSPTRWHSPSPSRRHHVSYTPPMGDRMCTILEKLEDVTRQMMQAQLERDARERMREERTIAALLALERKLQVQESARPGSALSWHEIARKSQSEFHVEKEKDVQGLFSLPQPYPNLPYATGLFSSKAGHVCIQMDRWEATWSVFPLKAFRGSSYTYMKIESHWDDERLLRELSRTYDRLRTFWRKWFSLRSVSSITMVLADHTFVYPQRVGPARVSPAKNMRLRYLLNHPHCMKTRREFMQVLTARTDLGIEFVEHFQLYRIAAAILIPVILSLVMGTVWSVLTGDVSGGFTVAGYMTSAYSVCLVLVGVLNLVES